MARGCCTVNLTPYLHKCLASVLNALIRVLTSFGAPFRLKTLQGKGVRREATAFACLVAAACSAAFLRLNNRFSSNKASLSSVTDLSSTVGNDCNSQTPRPALEEDFSAEGSACWRGRFCGVQGGSMRLE
eukprot:CAMPEP_0171101868 /NCGR_PEP_ID=MMETSP0766_2-20121228/56172_1 /TAXON_ID=439317 /ORGANISM="Gambierdiscus australes, Strain CAWD 149" /LENGTH=129 /DNA_ID=CAMNT_0011562011 /DNA_START=192 /DNA_END=581 /DNA_ORIENTATION=-